MKKSLLISLFSTLFLLYGWGQEVAVPSNVSATVINDRVIELAWNSVTGANKYNIYQSFYAEDGFTYRTSVGKTTYRVSGLEPGITYYFRVQAIRSDGIEGAPTDAVMATTMMDPPSIQYYSVRIPSVEGAWTQPSAGLYDVPEGESFPFVLFVEEEYDASAITVRVNGDIIHALPDQLNRSLYHSTASVSYRYLIDIIRKPLTIEVDGLQMNDPTGIGGIPVPTRLYSDNGTLFIETMDAERAEIYSITGKMVLARTIDGIASIPLSRGIYLVRLGTMVHKVVVR